MRDRHWLGMMVVGCLIVAAATLPPSAGAGPDSYGSPTRLWRAQSRLQAAVESLLALRSADSLLAVAERSGATVGTVPTLLIDPELPPAVGSLARRNLALTERELGGPAGDARTVVAVELDNGETLDGLPRGYYREERRYRRPSETNGATCLAAITIRGGWTRPQLDSGNVTPRTLGWDNSGGLLGQCAFYFAYGLPGPSIEQWIDLHDGYIADRPTAPPLAQASRTSLRSEGVTLSGLLEAVLGTARWWYSAGYLVIGDACALGRLDQCRIAALGDPDSIAGPGWRTLWYGRHPLGQYASQFLAAVAQDMGPERFRRFWKSELPVDSAFRAAAGVSIEEWTSKWLQAQYPDIPPAGPLPHLSSVVLSLIVAGLAVSGGCWLAARRTVE